MDTALFQAVFYALVAYRAVVEIYDYTRNKIEDAVWESRRQANMREWEAIWEALEAEEKPVKKKAPAKKKAAVKKKK